MLLAIDAGNTNVVFAVFDQNRKVGSWRISTDHNRTSDEYAVWLTHLMALVQLRPLDITDAILASVVPAANFHLQRLVRDHFRCEPLVIGAPGVKLGIEVVMDNPEEVGADRLVNAIAARERYQVPLIVIDFGTATTFDVVDRDGNYCGGVIAPGINLSLEALFMAAAKLPKVEIEEPKRVIGKGTIGAMKSGIFYGYVGLIEGLVTRIKAEYGEPMTVIATGGLAGLFARATNMIDHTDAELTLRGLRFIFEHNKAS
jgi:type III pantothenate kinase